jgi:hypothetical protein
VLVVLALGCKEDVAIYFAAFGLVVSFLHGDRRIGLATTALAVVWLLIALGVAIPHWRGLYGLEEANPFLESRYDTSGGAGAVASGVLTRVLSLSALSRVVTVFSATGFMCLLAPAWVGIAMAGLVLNLAAAPDTLQAALLGHYLWPILPWLFVAAAIGAGRLESSLAGRSLARRATLSGSPSLSAPPSRWIALAILLVALIDLPLPRAVARAPWRQSPEARAVLEQLQAIPRDASVLAQPNLIPHLPRRMDMHSLGVYTAGQPAAEYVLLTKVGDLWPFDEAGVTRLAAELAANPEYQQVSAGPLLGFRQR